MQTSAVTYKIERYTIDQLESKIKTYGKTMSKKKIKEDQKRAGSGVEFSRIGTS